MTMAENSGKTARRRGPGRPFRKGVSGNPGGRPKKLPITEVYEAILSDPKNRRLIEATIVRIVLRGNMASVLMLREMAERVEGKVMQEVGLSGDLSLVPDHELQARLDRLLKARERSKRPEKS